MKVAVKWVVTVAFAALLFFLLFPQDAVADSDEVLRVAFVLELPPYQFVEEDLFTGFHVELLLAAAEEQNVEIQWVPMNNLTECYQALRDNECDIVMGVTKKENGFVYSNEISTSRVAFVVTNERAKWLDENPQGKLSMISCEFGSLDSIPSYYYTIGHYRILEPSQQRAFQAFAEGRADGMYGDIHSIHYLMRKNEMEPSVTVYFDNVLPITYHLASTEGNDIILKKIDDGIQKIRASGAYGNIYQKWFLEEQKAETFSIRKIWETYRIYIITVIFFITVIIATLTIGNIVLNREVLKRTKELQMANTELKKQIRMNEYEGELRNKIIEHNPNGILLLDNDYTMVLVNKAAEKLLGEGLQNISPDKQEPLFSNLISEIQNTGTGWDDISAATYTYQKTPTEKATYQYSTIPLRDAENSPKLLMIIQDITPTIRASEQAAEEQNAKVLNQVVAGIAHEIRNPLMSIKTFGQLLAIRKDSAEFITQFAEIVPQEVDRIDRLVSALQDFSRPTPQISIRFNSSHTLNKCVDLLRVVASKNGTEFVLNIEEGLWINAKRDQVKQIFINILINSVQAIEEKRSKFSIRETLHIYIHAYSDGGYNYYDISDEGIGISSESIRHITEPFYTSKPTGNGLGLATSSKYVRENGGNLSYESVPDEGTTAHLTFPFSNEDK